jgi:tripartite-type tricarboxylate transporter receptor subunit TctC
MSEQNNGPGLTRRAMLAGTAALSLPMAARAASTYPDRPVRVIVAYGAGGAVDTVARLVFTEAGKRLGQSFVIENRGGAGGTLGAAAVARSAPDGYTLLDDASGFSINPSLMPRLSYDARKDFAPVARIITVPNVIVAGPSCPAKDLAELIALGKAKPGEMDCASTGTGSAQHLSLELLNHLAGLRIGHVPYRDLPAALNDLSAGRIALMVMTATSAIPRHGEGGLRVIAYLGRAPVQALPGVPAAIDTLTGLECLEWHGVYAPAGTPEPIVQALNAALAEAVREPTVAERLTALGADTEQLTPAGLATFLDGELNKWAGVIRDAGIRIQ